MATIAEGWRGTDNLLVREEMRKMQQRERIFQNAYLQGPWILPPEELMRQLKEAGLGEQAPWMLQDVLWREGWELMGGYGADTDAERNRAILDSVRLYKYSSLAQWAIWLWSNWGLGDKVTVTPNDEAAAKIFDEFWTANRNANVLADDRIHELSNWLLVKGNRFFTFYASDQDGEARVRLVSPEQITAIITNPNDDSDPWFYKREWTPKGGQQKTAFYPDWETFFAEDLEERWTKIIKSNTDVTKDSKRADKNNSADEQLGGDKLPGTAVCMLHVPHNIKDESSLWGWPLMTVSRPLISAHKHFLESRLTVAEGKAMFVRRKQVKGGSRALAGVIGTIASNLSATQYYDTNPPATAGSVEMDNAMVDTKDLPMTTGASDAKVDEEMFARQALLGTGLFPTSAGWDTARWATAVEMDKAQSMIFEGYQTFWASQFRKMVKIVLSFREKYGGETFEDKSAEVSIDSFSLADFTGVARAVGQLVRDAMTPLVADGTIPREAATHIMAELWRINLDALGVDQAQELTDVEGELWEEPEEEEPQPVVVEPEGEEPIPPEGEPEPEVVEQIAAKILENAREGIVDWQTVAEWALEEKMERQPRSAEEVMQDLDGLVQETERQRRKGEKE